MTILAASRRTQRRRRALLLALRFATPLRRSDTGRSVPVRPALPQVPPKTTAERITH